MTPCICREDASFWIRVHIRLLTEDEENRARKCAEARLANAKKKGLKDYLGADSIESHLLGARGELALSIALGIEWQCQVDAFTSKPDLPPDIEVRTARKTFLKIRPKEVDDPSLRDRRYVLLTPGRPDYVSEHQVGESFVLWGFLRAREAFGELLDDPGDRGRPAYFIRADRLHRMPFDGHREPKVKPTSAHLTRTPEGKFEVAR